MRCCFELLDLEKAYLQIHVDESLRKYQTVGCRGRLYRLTRLGFGLNCAPVIRAGILRKVLAQDPLIEQATDSYLDDILVREDLVSAHEVSRHLATFGLKCKASEPFHEAKVLGLQMSKEGEELRWRRGSAIDSSIVVEGMTRRRLFSLWPINWSLACWVVACRL